MGDDTMFTKMKLAIEKKKNLRMRAKLEKLLMIAQTQEEKDIIITSLILLDSLAVRDLKRIL